MYRSNGHSQYYLLLFNAAEGEDGLRGRVAAGGPAPPAPAGF